MWSFPGNARKGGWGLKTCPWLGQGWGTCPSGLCAPPPCHMAVGVAGLAFHSSQLPGLCEVADAFRAGLMLGRDATPGGPWEGGSGLGSLPSGSWTPGTNFRACCGQPWAHPWKHLRVLPNMLVSVLGSRCRPPVGAPWGSPSVASIEQGGPGCCPPCDCPV